MSWRSVLVALACLSTAGLATPQMPPSPIPPDAVQEVATLFSIDLEKAEQEQQHLRIPYFQRQSKPAVSDTVLPPEMLPVGYTPTDRGKLGYAYMLRRVVLRNNYQTVFERDGVSYITMACLEGFPLLDSASNIEQGMAVCLLPNAGPDTHQLHVMSLQKNGRPKLSAPVGRVEFSDGQHIFDVLIPTDGSRIKVRAVLPSDKTF